MKVELVDKMGSDLTVVNAQSIHTVKSPNGKELFQVPTEGALSEKDEKLIKYSAKHNHWSPLVSC